MSHYVFTAQNMSVKLGNGFPRGAFKLALKILSQESSRKVLNNDDFVGLSIYYLFTLQDMAYISLCKF